jgi:hypothetical protein
MRWISCRPAACPAPERAAEEAVQYEKGPRKQPLFLVGRAGHASLSSQISGMSPPMISSPITFALKTLLMAVAISLAMPVVADEALAGAKKKTSITVRKQSAWKGYGFLPGYPRNARERQRDSALTERRYIDSYGRVSYGFGGPGFYRGQYNGGSFGPCWTSTPIGMMWNCGR